MNVNSNLAVADAVLRQGALSGAVHAGGDGAAVDGALGRVAAGALQVAAPFIIQARGETPVRIGMVDSITHLAKHESAPTQSNQSQPICASHHA